MKISKTMKDFLFALFDGAWALVGVFFVLEGLATQEITVIILGILFLLNFRIATIGWEVRKMRP